MTATGGRLAPCELRDQHRVNHQGAQGQHVLNASRKKPIEELKQCGREEAAQIDEGRRTSNPIEGTTDYRLAILDELILERTRK